MAAAIWREREGAGEGESDQNVTKNQRWRYLRARGSTAVLLGMSGSSIRHRSSGYGAAVASFDRQTEKRRREGIRLGAL